MRPFASWIGLLLSAIGPLSLPSATASLQAHSTLGPFAFLYQDRTEEIQLRRFLKSKKVPAFESFGEGIVAVNLMPATEKAVTAIVADYKDRFGVDLDLRDAHGMVRRTLHLLTVFKGEATRIDLVIQELASHSVAAETLSELVRRGVVSNADLVETVSLDVEPWLDDFNHRTEAIKGVIVKVAGASRIEIPFNIVR